MLPNFLGVGVPRGGTTWLHELLMSHPEAAVPTLRKEIRFFDKYYDRGIPWYERFFPSDSEAGRYAAIGEISPQYLYHREVPGRIAKLGTVERLIIMLRDPVKRAFSHYQLALLGGPYRGSFRQFLEDRPTAITFGRYADGLERYLEQFGHSQVRVFIHELAFADTSALKTQIAAHLNIDPERFPDDAGHHRINQIELPRFARAYASAVKVNMWLRQHDLDAVPNYFVRRLGIKRWFGKSRPPEVTLDPGDQMRLHEMFARDIDRVEQLLGTDLSVWRTSSTSSPRHES